MPRAFWAAAACAAALVAVAVPSAPRPADPASLLPPPGRYDVRILRDTWGVPHVFGRTDADAAYGLAFAHAEDDFETIQWSLLAARGRLAARLDTKDAPNDFVVQLLRVRDVVDAGYERDLSPATRALCEAYADGVNHYAALHPEQAWPGLFPAKGRDVVAGFVHKLPFFFGLDRVLTNLLSEKADAPALAGSNAFAIAPSRSADGATRLVVNSHQPWTGPVAWYEAHVHSEEGWRRPRECHHDHEPRRRRSKSHRHFDARGKSRASESIRSHGVQWHRWTPMPRDVVRRRSARRHGSHRVESL